VPCFCDKTFKGDDLMVDADYLLIALTVLCLLCLSACTGQKPTTNITNETGLLEKNITNETNVTSKPLEEVEQHEEKPEQEEQEEPTQLCAGLFGDEYDTCMAVETGDLSYCDNDNCYLNYAVTKEDSSICEYMSTDAMKCYCVSLITDNGCATCPSESARDLCYTLLTENTDKDYCQKIVTPRYQRDCFTFMAVREHNSNLCKQIDDSYLRDECYREYAKETGDVAACEEQFVESWIDACYRDAAYANNKPQLCNGIDNFRNQKVCYSVVFESDRYELDDCYEISYPEWKNRCIKFLAINKNDESICDYIENEDDKNRCKLSVEELGEG